MLFNKANYQPATTSSFAYSDALYSSLQNDIAALTQYQNAVNSGMSSTQAFDAYLREASINAQKYANSVNASTISLEDYQNHLNQTDITSQAQNKSLSNCKILIDEYSTGLKKCGLTQEQYIGAIQKSNPQLANYISNLNGAKGSVGDYVGSLIAAKAATIGLQIATTALNAAISMGISFLVSGAVQLLNEIIVTEEELIEKSEEAANRISEISDSFKANSKTVSEISERFAELAQGVDDLTGKNNSLTPDEYEEFLDLSNQLADIFPTLSRHYDENGNAIVDLSGDVDTIVGSLSNLLEVERQITNQKIAEDLPDLYDGILTKSQDYIDDIEYYEGKKKELEDAYNILTSDDFNTNFDNMLQGNTFNITSADKNLEEFNKITDEYLAVLEELGLSYEYLSTDYGDNGEPVGYYYNITNFAYMSDEEIEETKKKIQSGIQDLAATYVSEIENYNQKIQNTKNENKANWSSVLSSITSWLATDNGYKILSDTSQTLVQNAINSLDFSELNFEKWEDLEEYINKNILSIFKGQNSAELSDLLSETYGVKTNFENNKTSLENYTTAIESFVNTLNDLELTDESKEILYGMLGISFDDSGEIQTDYDNYSNAAKEILQDEYDENVEQLSLEDLKIAAELEVSDGTLYTWDELKSKIEEAKKALSDSEDSAKSFSEKISEVGSLSDGFDKLSNIYKDISDGGDFDVSSLFSKDFSETFSGLGESYDNFIKTVASSPNDIAACQSAFNDLATAYINNSDVLNGLTEDTKETTIALLEQMGVTNASAIVEAKLAYQKAQTKYATSEYTDKTWEQIQAEYATAEAGTAEKQVLAELAVQKYLVNKATLNTVADIKQLEELATAAGATIEYLTRLAEAKSLIAQWDDITDPRGKSALASKIRQLTENVEYDPVEFDYTITPVYKPTTSSSGSSSSEDKIESFDWIEIAIDRIESAIDKLKSTASSAYETIKTKISGASDAISKVTEEIKLQEKAYKRYMQEANSVGLSSDLAKKVQNGTIDINEYNSDTKELIEDYQSWYKKALTCKDAIDELHESLADLYSEKFDTLSQDFENQLSEIEHAANSFNNKISEYEAKGYLNTKSFYQSLMEIETKNLNLLNEQYSSLKQALKDAVSSGEIEEGSDAWYDMQLEINEVNEAIQESTLSTLEFANAIRDIDWEIFEFLQEQISQVNSEVEFLIKLMSNDKLFDDKGKITDEGFATMGLHGVSYNVYMRQADEYAAEIEKINAQLANDPANTELIEKKQEYIDLQKESILAAEDEKQAIIDLVEEGFNLELDYLNELIDKYTDALDSAKNLYDYQKKISEYTDEISSLEKQISAYSGDDSEEGRLKIQELTKELKSTKDDLEEAEYDKYISDQKELLSDLYDTYEEILNKRLDNIDGLLKDIFDGINTNASTINTTLSGVAEGVGISLSDALSTIWNVDTDAANGDVNGDGKITSADARTILRAAAGLETLSGDALKNADVNSDGEITAADARLVSRVAAGLDELPTNSVISIYDNEFSNKLTSVNSVLDTISDNVKKITSGIQADVNKDGVVDKTDAQIVLEASAGLGTVNLAYDINNDGDVTAADVKLILEKQGIKAYKTGGLVDYTGLAKVDGTSNKPELVLNAEDTENFLELNDCLRELAKQPLTIGDNLYSHKYDVIDAPQLTGVLDLSGKMSELRKTNEMHTNITNHYDINIPIDHVQDYNDFVNQLKKDSKFEKMVQAATTDRLIGKSSLAKHKYSW